MMREEGGGMDKLAGSIETSVVPMGSACRLFVLATELGWLPAGPMEEDAREKECETDRETVDSRRGMARESASMTL